MRRYYLFFPDDHLVELVFKVESFFLELFEHLIGRCFNTFFHSKHFVVQLMVFIEQFFEVFV